MDILISNIITYSLISLIFLSLGFITGIHKNIGYIAIILMITLVVCILIIDIITIVNNGSVTVSIVNGDNPIIMYIGAVVAGMTLDHWFNSGKKLGRKINNRFLSFKKRLYK